MDWAVWDQTLDQVPQESSLMGNEGQYDFYFGCGHDLIQENALNEKSCIQVLRVLITKANTEILELEEDLITLQSQLAWTDEAWSDICSAALREKIDCLDILIRSLKNTNVQDEHDFGVCLLLPREPAETMHEILKALPGNYFHQKDEQPVNSDIPTKDPYVKTEENDIAEKGKGENTIVEDSISDALVQATNDSNENKELGKFDMISNGNDGLKKQSYASKDRSLVLNSSLMIARKRRNFPRRIKPDNTSSLDASKYAIGTKRKNKFSMKASKVSGREENKQNSTDQSIILESYLQRGGRESTIPDPVESADDIVEFRSSASQDVSEESDVNPPKLSNDPDYNPTNEIDPPLSSFKIGKQRAKAPRRMKDPETGLTEAEQNAADSLLQLLLHKRGHKTKQQQKGKQIQEAKTDDESNSNLPLKPQKPRSKRQRQHKPKSPSELRAAEQGGVASGSRKKRKFQSLPGLDESLQMSLAKLCTDKAETTSVEDLCAAKCSFTGDPPQTDPPDLPPPPPMLPLSAPSGLDLECLSLVDLRTIAKEYHMRGYSMLKKAELIEELGLKLAIHGCT
ncbi:uncharacterized protein LOC130757028 isoform X1 [Actinidia eriantha]|uniref:uncharacterized protein LOC130757028 isoform X1 n=1 Tax=Actinidia eriantha TaxID=165200 RepID=UPI00258FD087|nr:uncharacterized protein LOC130757028 isoform X1 [Actinidia eriantha]XP_057467660.1 uncharacterized protein LOC130757028 isoform X1 [Actinidia eriantha]